MFNATNFPNASSAQLTAAQNLYALLTGRVSSVTSDARIDEENGLYTYPAGRAARADARDRVFIQDQWRVRSNVTVNAGVRYGVQLPFSPLNSNYSFGSMTEICGVSGVGSDGACNLFQPGIRAARTTLPQFTHSAPRLQRGQEQPGAERRRVVWTPQRRDGWLGTVMGPEGNFVIRGGCSRNYSRPGLNDFTGPFNNNTGLVSRSPALRRHSCCFAIRARPRSLRSMPRQVPRSRRRSRAR
jgi:hypothetical protein